MDLNIWGEPVSRIVDLGTSNRGRHARGLTLTKRTHGASAAKGQRDGGFRPSARGMALPRIRKVTV